MRGESVAAFPIEGEGSLRVTVSLVVLDDAELEWETMELCADDITIHIGVK